MGRYVYLGAGVCRGQKRESDTLEPLLEAAGSYLECVLGTESEPLAGARNALNHVASFQIHKKGNNELAKQVAKLCQASRGTERLAETA